MPKGVYSRPAIETPRVLWDTLFVHDVYAHMHDHDFLLQLGWEPFTMDGHTMWYRRVR